MLKCENLPRTNSTKYETQNILVKFQQNEHTPGRVLRLFHNKVYLYYSHMLGSGDLWEGLTSISQQGLFVPFARVRSSDTVRVLRLFHNKVYLYRLHA